MANGQKNIELKKRSFELLDERRLIELEKLSDFYNSNMAAIDNASPNCDDDSLNEYINLIKESEKLKSELTSESDDKTAAFNKYEEKTNKYKDMISNNQKKWECDNDETLNGLLRLSLNCDFLYLKVLELYEEIESQQSKMSSPNKPQQSETSGPSESHKISECDELEGLERNKCFEYARNRSEITHRHDRLYPGGNKKSYKKRRASKKNCRKTVTKRIKKRRKHSARKNI
jgi:hypothetical protein